MSDDNKIGVVGRSPAQNPQRGVPGVAQPPTPSAEEIQRVTQLQRQRLAEDAQESARRAAELAKLQTGQTVYGMELPRQQIPDSILAQMPPQMSMPAPAQNHNVSRGADNSSGNQFERRSDTSSQPKKLEIPWWPIRSKGVSIELSNSIIKGIPERGMAEEGDAASKVILALFDELLMIREAVLGLEDSAASSNPQNDDLARRVYHLEATLFEQRKSMASQARSVREQVEILQANGLSSDEIIKSLQEQSLRAEKMIVNT